MKALVVYESMFGNTEQIARAVAEGLGRHMEVTLVEASQAPQATTGLDLVVVGGPTHAFSMSRSSTREDAVTRGAKHPATKTGIREWLEHLHAGHHEELMATFDTRVGKVRHLPGSAARSAAKAGRRLGYTAATKAESFWVEDVDGPLFEGEVERARRWGERLAGDVEQRADLSHN